MDTKTTKLSKIISFLMLMTVLSVCKAATITVDGLCTLADAILAANTDQASGSCSAGEAEDIITFANANETLVVNQGAFPSVVQGNMMLAFPAIESAITIEGNGLHIMADAAVNKFRVLELFGASNFQLVLRDVHISGADNDSGTGSALFTLGANLVLERCRFSNNHGAIMMTETLNSTIEETVVENNWALESDIFSPGLEANGVSLDIVNSSFVNNEVIFTGTDFNMSEGHPGGGISITHPGSGPIKIINTTISGNQSITGGGLVIRENAAVALSQGIPIPAALQIINSTIANNTAVFAGGVAMHGVNSTVQFEHNLIVGNSADQAEGRELWVEQGANLSMDAHNLIQQHQINAGLQAVLGNSDIISDQSTSELIQPLATINFLPVHKLQTGSDAIDVDSAVCFLSTDQLGQQRPADGDGDGEAFCDAGAIELPDVIFSSGFEPSI